MNCQVGFKRAGFMRAVSTAVVCAVFMPGMAVATSGHDATSHAHGLVQQIAERGIIIGKRNLAIGTGLVFSSGVTSSYGVVVPIRYGVRDKLEIFVSPRWQNIAPTFSDPAIGAMYRFRDGLIQVAGRASFQLALLVPTKSAAVDLSAPIRLHARENLSLDASPTLSILVLPTAEWYLNLPLGGNFNLTDAIAITGGAQFTMRAGLAGASGMFVGGSWTAAKDGKPWLEMGGRAAWTTVGNVAVMQLSVFARYYGHDLGRHVGQ